MYISDKQTCQVLNFSPFPLPLFIWPESNTNAAIFSLRVTSIFIDWINSRWLINAVLKGLKAVELFEDFLTAPALQDILVLLKVSVFVFLTRDKMCHACTACICTSGNRVAAVETVCALCHLSKSSNWCVWMYMWRKRLWCWSVNLPGGALKEQHRERKGDGGDLPWPVSDMKEMKEQEKKKKRKTLMSFQWDSPSLPAVDFMPACAAVNPLYSWTGYTWS